MISILFAVDFPSGDVPERLMAKKERRIPVELKEPFLDLGSFTVNIIRGENVVGYWKLSIILVAKKNKYAALYNYKPQLHDFILQELHTVINIMEQEPEIMVLSDLKKRLVILINEMVQKNLNIADSVASISIDGTIISRNPVKNDPNSSTVTAKE